MTTNDESNDAARRYQRPWRSVTLVLVLAVCFVVVQQVISRYEANVATDTARELAAPVDRLCRDDPSVAREIGESSCDVAADVRRESTVVAAPRDGTNGRDGMNGADGPAGRGVAGTAVADGRLLVTYTDGQHVDLGPVVGATGPTGAVGRGVVGATVDEAGQLIVTYTDGTSSAVGRVVGVRGDVGRGVARVEARDGRLVVFYDDDPDVAVDVGVLPTARGIVSLDLDLDRCVVTVRYTDETVEERPVGGCEPRPTVPPTGESPG